MRRSMLVALVVVAAVTIAGRQRPPGFVLVRDFDDGRVGRPVLGKPDGMDFWSSSSYDAQGFAGTQGARDDLVGYWPQPPCAKGDAWGGGIVLPERARKFDELWVRVRVFFPVGWKWRTNGVGMKFIRLTRHNANGSNAGRYDFYLYEAGNPLEPRQPYLINEFGGDTRYYFGDGDEDNPRLGAWESWEMYFALDDVPVDAGGMGRVRVWKNGVLLVDRTDEPTLNDAWETVPDVLISTYWNNPCEAPVASQSVWYDDIQIQTQTPSELDADGNPMIGP